MGHPEDLKKTCLNILNIYEYIWYDFLTFSRRQTKKCIDITPSLAGSNIDNYRFGCRRRLFDLTILVIIRATITNFGTILITISDGC